MLLRNNGFVRPIEQPTAEAYCHEVPGDRPAAGGYDCLLGGQRQGGHTWVGASYVFFWVCLGRHQINERTQDS